jgi:4-hydroxybenzoate polyprenyltransferase
LVFGIYYPKNLTSKIIGFKNLYVSLFWALSIVFLALYTNSKFEPTLLILFIFVFLRFIVSTVFFDLKDIESDKKEGLKTIPTVFGLRETTRLLNIVNLVSVLLLVGAILFRILPVYSASLVLFFFYDLYYVTWGAKKEKGVLRFISYVVVDGEYIFWPIIITFSKLIMG